MHKQATEQWSQLSVALGASGEDPIRSYSTREREAYGQLFYKEFDVYLSC